MSPISRRESGGAPSCLSPLSRGPGRGGWGERATLRSLLLAWFDKAKRDLPWRRARDPYAIWVSEAMLQQTQVATVIPYYGRFLDRFPTIQDLAAAPIAEVLSMWRGLGYYSRARQLQKAAGEVVAHFGGKLPASAEQLRSLPGFGPYTAGAVASIAFDLPEALVDGNVARVYSRLFALKGDPRDKKPSERLWTVAREMVQGDRPGDFNQSLMELGALVCLPRSPTCLLCPVTALCEARKRGLVEKLPERHPPRQRKALHLACAVIRKGDSILLGRRPEKGLFGGLWELPSVEFIPKTRTNAPAVAALKVLGLRAGAHLGCVQRTLTHRDLSMDLFEVKGIRIPSGTAYVELKLQPTSALGSLGIASAMQAALRWALQ